MVSLVSKNMNMNFPSDDVIKVEEIIIIVLVIIYKKYW